MLYLFVQSYYIVLIDTTLLITGKNDLTFLFVLQLITGYFEASVLTCMLRCWFREIGFSISYGALLLKTWR
jgi:hypothetical protein